MAGSYAETYFLGEPSITLKSINFFLQWSSNQDKFQAHISKFTHPEIHLLTVQEIEQQTVPQNSFGSDRWIYPTHYIAMSYTLTPEPMENISVFDCDEGDRPIEVTPDDHSFRPVGSSSCFVVGVIGGADGPTAVIYGTNSQEKLHAACSALHFEPVGDDVEWRIVFNVTQFDKETFPII